MKEIANEMKYTFIRKLRSVDMCRVYLVVLLMSQTSTPQTADAVIQTTRNGNTKEATTTTTINEKKFVDFK